MLTDATFAALVGILWGARHAFEPDHLAAVSTLAAGDSRGRSAWSLGALWGLGHSISLLALAGALALLEVAMPPAAARALEFGVAAMLLALGGRAVWRAFSEGGKGAARVHQHFGVAHAHPAAPQHLHLRRWTVSARPLWVGLLHGLAGSGALTALVLAELHSAAARLTYIALFGLGSTLGMALLTGLLGVSLSRFASAPRASRWLLFGAGLTSVVMGLVWGAQAASSTGG